MTRFLILILSLFIFPLYIFAQDKDTTDSKESHPKITLVGSKKSDKYHVPSCTYAGKIKSENKITFTSVDEAKKAGYKPCKVCMPEDAKKIEEPKDKEKKKTESYSAQCQAITKKGTRCKRKAASGSKYCWQHKK